MRVPLSSYPSASSRDSLQGFLDPRIAALEQVGSRELEQAIERLRHQGRSAIAVHGYPVVAPPEHVLEAAREASGSTCFPPSNGLPELRESLARTIESQYGTAADEGTEVLITGGAMHALHVVLTALLCPDDEILLVSPCYFFGGLVSITGARPVYVEAREQDDYALDFDRIRGAITSRTKVIVLSSPVNPTGYVYSWSDVEQFVALAEEHNLLLLSDESYDRMTYDSLEHVSPRHFPEAVRRTVLVKSFTKSYALPTWRVGYIAADAALIPSFRKVLEWTMLHCPYINQRVALAALDGPQDWLQRVFCDFEKRRNQLMEGLAGLSRLRCVRPRGGPFIFLNVSGKRKDAQQFAREMLEGFGIPGVAGTYFHSPSHVRIPFGGSAQAVAQLVSALQAAETALADDVS